MGACSQQIAGDQILRWPPWHIDDRYRRSPLCPNERTSSVRAIRSEKCQQATSLGACPNSRCSNLRDSDSTFGYEQVFSSLEYRSNAAAAAERAGLRAERPCLAIYR